MNGFDAARSIADAVLYEGYLLYPYTASARKNRQRWQFGVVMPRAYAALDPSESASMRTEIPFVANGALPAVNGLVRFLHLQTRDVETYSGGEFSPIESLEIDGERFISWEEAVEREVPFEAAVGESREVPFAFPQSRSEEALVDVNGALRGRIVRETRALRGRIAVDSCAVGGGVRLGVRVENDSPLHGGDRASALKTALVSCHALLAARGGAFVSIMDVPEGARAIADACRNDGTWPVLLGPPLADPRYAVTVLSSPIILYDYVTTAARSDGDKYDGTEVDELLNLSILSMSDEERREARATDPRARRLVDRAVSLSPESFASLHGEVRFDEGPAFETEESQPGVARLDVNGVAVQKGSRVRLHPSRQADVWDIFLRDKIAHVKGVYEDFERQRYVSVTIDDDPATEMHEWYGRSLFFYPEEIEPLEAGA